MIWELGRTKLHSNKRAAKNCWTISNSISQKSASSIVFKFVGALWVLGGGKTVKNTSGQIQGGIRRTNWTHLLYCNKCAADCSILL